MLKIDIYAGKEGRKLSLYKILQKHLACDLEEWGFFIPYYKMAVLLGTEKWIDKNICWNISSLAINEKATVDIDGV